MSWLTIAVGAEGVAEVQGKPWIRDATEEEVQNWTKERSSAFDAKALLMDNTGRPYFLMSVDPENAPIHVVEKAKVYVRVLRLA